MPVPTGPGRERLTVTERGLPRNSGLDKIASSIGLGPLPDSKAVRSHYDVLQGQLEIGLRRPDSAKPTTSDGGILAIRSGVRPTTAQEWLATPVRARALNVEYGGTNLNVKVAEKQASGGIAQSDVLHHEEFAMDNRAVPYEEHIRRLAEPIGRLGKELSIEDFAISLGLMHTGEQTAYGLEAHLLTETGVLDKGVAVTNWNQIAPDERRIVRDVRRQSERKGKGIAVNDTIGVALDGDSKVQAGLQGFEVLDDGQVAGSGTNKAKGRKLRRTASGLTVVEDAPKQLVTPQSESDLINTEIGHANWPDDRVSQEMRRRLLEIKYIQPEKDKPEFEYETGQYLPHRLTAGLRLLAREGVIDVGNTRELTERIEKRALENPAVMSHLATGAEFVTEGDSHINEVVQRLAQLTMERAEQMYGIFTATGTTAPAEGEEDKIFAIPTEGSVLLKGQSGPERSLKENAEAVAKELTGRNVVVFPAAGLEGVAAKVMVVSNQKAA